MCGRRRAVPRNRSRAPVSPSSPPRRLTPRAMRRLAETFAAQPPWSEIPLMIFVAQPEMDRAARSFEALGPRAHVTLVDRPIHVKTLLSSVRTSLRSRAAPVRHPRPPGRAAEAAGERARLGVAAVRTRGSVAGHRLGAVARRRPEDDHRPGGEGDQLRLRVDLAEGEGERRPADDRGHVGRRRRTRVTASTSARNSCSTRSRIRSTAR